MPTFEDIKAANQTIKTTDIKDKAYAEVNQRVKAFRMVYPMGTIATEILSLADGIVTMKATALDGEGHVLATGHAQEKETSSYINKTSYIENCETSAVGRALGMCGFGIDTSICSAEELSNALENQNKNQHVNQTDEDPLGINPVCANCGTEISVKVHDFSVKQFKKPLCMKCQKEAGKC